VANRRPRSITDRTQVHARRLREDFTLAEQKIWAHLRRKHVVGLKFRRQQPIGPYIVDFFCPAAGLIIEVDGDTHADKEQHDAARTRWLEGEGYRVIRFVNSEVHRHLNLVLERISEECMRHAEGDGEEEYPSP